MNPDGMIADLQRQIAAVRDRVATLEGIDQGVEKRLDRLETMISNLMLVLIDRRMNSGDQKPDKDSPAEVRPSE